MKLTIKILLLLLFVTNYVQGQVIWTYDRNLNADLFLKDSRSDDLQLLRDIILEDHIGDSHFNYSNAIEYLYLNHLDTETAFLKENLRTVVDISINSIQLDHQWMKYYIDKFFLGLLGEQSAIIGMDSVADYSTNKIVKSSAIINLAEIDQFNYFDYVKDSYINQKNDININTLVMYGEDNRYKQEVINLVENELRSINSSNYISVMRYIDYIFRLNRDYALSLLEEYFINTEGDIRWYYFTELYLKDKHGQPMRTMYVLPIETDPYWQGRYIQNPKQIQLAKKSHHYLEPFFINFLINVELTNNDVHLRRLSYLQSYKPFKPDSTTTISVMLDTLTSFTLQSYNYSWLSDEPYKNELIIKLQTTKDYLSSSDSLNCAKEIKSFQESIEQVHADSAGSYPKYVNDDAYKFLYYYPQYILDRLPEMPDMSVKEK